ncbi:MAG TPA: hypothetical protein VH061_02395 [Solirubrobacteraceae bacterium]|jgi:hypothetical protein|nr:hypothetical protein [Solirubrobacteraceae bacterium]
MNDFLQSVKADLSDRRLLPAVGLIGVCLIAALAYALLGGGSSAPAPQTAAVTPATPTAPGLSVSETASEKAVAETTDGFKEQRSGHARDPFAQIAGTSSTTTTSSATSSSGSSSAAGSESSSSTESSGGVSSGGTEPAQSESGKSGTTKKSKTKAVYDVAVEFGVLSAGTTPEAAQLTAYAKLKLQTPLPDAKQALLVFRGVTTKGKSATFTLVGEAILTGTGACLPNASQCQAVDLKPGETEQLSYLAPNGETTVYELRVISITPAKAKASTAKAGGWPESKEGRELLRHSGLIAVPDLHYSSQPGVLVFAGHGAFASRAHTALLPHRR